MGASQMLKTQVALNWMGALIHMAPGNIMALEPTLHIAKRLSDRIEKNIACVPELRARAEPRSRDSRNTMDTKQYPGGSLFITTAGSAANLAEVSIRYLYGDELDRWEGNVGGEGDPVVLAEARTTTFGRNAKIYYSSSPTIEGGSRIHNLYQEGNQQHYHVPCPECGEYQVLQFEQLRWSETTREASYICPHCGVHLPESSKASMLEQGEWRASAAGDGETVSFHISALYMPPGWLSWAGLLKEYDKASSPGCGRHRTHASVLQHPSGQGVGQRPGTHQGQRAIQPGRKLRPAQHPAGRADAHCRRRHPGQSAGIADQRLGHRPGKLGDRPAGHHG
jgi:phage terminase large subunit GpA-like protein